MKKYVWLLLALLLCTLTMSASADAPTIEFSVQSGFYNFAQQLKIACSDKKATIYYTTDGSVPDETDRKYTRPVYMSWSSDRADLLMKRTGVNAAGDFIPEADFPTGHVIRAVAINAKGERSEVVSGTYFINVDRKALYGDMPVICLVADPEDLFDHEKGLFVMGQVYEAWAAKQTGDVNPHLAQANCTQTGAEWTRDAAVTWLPAAGERRSWQMQLTVLQGSNAVVSGQKPLRLSVRDEDAAVTADFFSEDGEETYRSFILSNGGTDCDYAKFREPLAARLAEGMELASYKNRPCIVFINGEYWGLYILREELDERCIQAREGVAAEDVYVLANRDDRNDDTAARELYGQLQDYIMQHDMADPAHYAQAASMLDMASYADYCAVQLYILNNEGRLQNGSWRMWRPKAANGKWRMLLQDLDASSDRYGDAMAADVDNVSPALEEVGTSSYNAEKLFPALMKNPDFAALFIRACCDVRNLYFGGDRLAEVFDSFKAQYQPYMPDTIRRFGPSWAQWGPEKSYRRELEELLAFYQERHGTFLPIVQNALKLGDACEVTVQTSDPAKGSVYLNGRSVAAQPGACYLYFAEGGLSAAAVPAGSAKFTGWTISGDGALADTDALSTQISFAGSITLTANFE